MARTSTGPRGIVVSTYVDPDEAARIRAVAEAADRTVAAELRRALRRYLLQQEGAPTEEAERR